MNPRPTFFRRKLTTLIRRYPIWGFLSSNRVLTHISPCFALFDSQLANMKLPILTQPDYQDDTSLRLEPLAPIVQRYFEWMVVTNPEQDLVDGDRRRKGMNLYRVDRYPGVAETWEWWEAPDLADSSGQPGKVFVWGG
ncbi:hypothetical protein BDZ94DRAFT_555451 [Collybia nuda]|uniref:Uncharacterized protein n=1 Tax=Collybia nuda TaxID=64659 RepID=A0A9P6CP54_9AGAR|nr:hypothetical protein BDZ94DRAFT_555451 [Collybia nuda]